MRSCCTDKVHAARHIALKLLYLSPNVADKSTVCCIQSSNVLAFWQMFSFCCTINTLMSLRKLKANFDIIHEHSWKMERQIYWITAGYNILCTGMCRRKQKI